MRVIPHKDKNDHKDDWACIVIFAEFDDSELCLPALGMAESNNNERKVKIGYQLFDSIFFKASLIKHYVAFYKKK